MEAVAFLCYRYAMPKNSRLQSHNADKFMLRLPDGMRARIADEAKKNNRSMNSEIVARIGDYLSRHADCSDTSNFPSHLSEIVARLDQLERNQLGMKMMLQKFFEILRQDSPEG